MIKRLQPLDDIIFLKNKYEILLEMVDEEKYNKESNILIEEGYVNSDNEIIGKNVFKKKEI